ncbi:MAG TPA: exodeoxyribonuclease VII large subunit [Acidobacteriaceae bacterium]|nr:exodeoxyribonuclease VII large subunit [Acidobacteriaceae bacterium]
MNHQSSPRNATELPQLGFLFPEEQEAAPATVVRAPWKVHELVAEMRRHIERKYLDVRVEGEISNLRQAASGHVYFTLKDSESQLPVVLFRTAARVLRFAPKDGLEVMVRGKISVYEDRGQLQLVAETMEPRGKGSLQVAFEQLYARLKEEGLFSSERKRPMPAFPRTIGIISSPSGAVIHDMLNILARRHARVNVLLYPAAVQGDAAAEEIAQGLAWFNANGAADVLVVARGGGSLEDLAAFNSETVARAIRASQIPVVSAVGHETDFTIADFAADLRAPTPSAAAELITDTQYRIDEYLQTLATRLERIMRYRLLLAREPYTSLGATAVFARMQDGFARRQQRVDELRFRLETAWTRNRVSVTHQFTTLEDRLLRQDVGRQLSQRREHLHTLRLRLEQSSAMQLDRQRNRSHRAQDRLHALSPLAVLERGYALVYSSHNMLVKDATRLHPEDTLRLRFARGGATARVLESTPTSETENKK